jgi:hypothetical protein
MKTDKAALKALRQERAHIIAEANGKIKEHNGIIKRIKSNIPTGGLTIPAIAEATGLSTARTLLFVATLKKYGEIIEGDKDGDYFRYKLAE